MNFQIPEEKKALVREIIKKALQDKSYKERLVKNPLEAIHELYPDFDVDNDKEMIFTDRTDTDNYYIDISFLSYSLYGGELDEMELSEKDLEMVAGGAADWTVKSCYILTCITVER